MAEQYKDIIRKDGDYILKRANGDLAQDADQYGVIFIARHPIEILRVSEVHSTAGTDGSAVTLDVEKLTGTTAPGSGATILGSTFDLKSTANTVVNKETINLVSGLGRILQEGDRLALVDTGTLTALTDVCVTIYYKTAGQGDYR